MSTTNAMATLKEIIRDHGRPKIINTDSKPSFRGEYTTQVQAQNIDNMYSDTYMPQCNARAERSVNIAPSMSELNSLLSDMSLQDLIMACNSREPGVKGAGAAFKRLLGCQLIKKPQCKRNWGLTEENIEN